MDVPVSPWSDPLTSESTARVFAAISAARRSVSTLEIAEQVDIHPNSARKHIALLLEAGLIEGRDEHSGVRGRPRKLWSVAVDAEPGGAPPEAYRELADWLSRSVDGPGDARAEGRRVGAEIGSGSHAEDTADALGSALAAMGFQPRRHDTGARTAFTLCNCPYREVAKSNPGIVCALHRGVAEGMVEAIDPGAAVARFVVEDPFSAGCVVEIERPDRIVGTEADR